MIVRLRFPSFGVALVAATGCMSAPTPSSPAPQQSALAPHAATTATPPAAPLPAPIPPASSSPASAAPSATTQPVASAPAPGASSSAPPDTPALPSVDAVLRGEDGSLLPQTEERPSLESPLFQLRTKLLLDAIVRDEPALARPFFFPVEAYEQVKAIAKPAQDWRHRLWRNFERDVHEYHAKLGADPQRASLERIEVREQASRWMKPSSEGNRIGYYRVTRSAIVGKTSDGKPLRLELTSMISWRGEWFVVHLHGFR